jgi:hypothetical protein
MEHNSSLTYAGSSSSHRPIVNPPPSADFPDIDRLDCTTTGTPKARGTIKNTSAQTADYNFAVYFYLAGQEYLGSEVARTYVQVYAVKPGETVQYETGPKPGDTIQLPPGTVCRGNLIQRVESGPDSLTDSGKTVTPDVCSLLTADDFTAIFGTPAEPDPGKDECSWMIESYSGVLRLYRSENRYSIQYDKTYPAPCPGGEMGLYPQHFSATCTVGKTTYVFELPSYEEPSPELVGQMTRLVTAAIARAG